MFISVKNRCLRLQSFWLLSVLMFVSCHEDDFNTINQIRQEPEIRISEEQQTIEAYLGQTVTAAVSLEAQSGILNISVLRNGEPLEEIKGASGEVNYTYHINYTVGTELEPGDQFVYHFILKDNEGREVEQDFTIKIVESPPVPDFEFEDVTVGGNAYKLINLDINRDVTLSSDYDYLLRGKVAVIEESTLHIEAGTKIYAEASSALVVSKGSRIEAAGNVDHPIRFTSIRERSGGSQAGDWIGIFLHGSAPVAGGEDVVITGSSGVGRGYGGTDNEDNSGSMKYVEIAYAGGYLIGTNSGITGALNLNGVGAGTELEHIFIPEAGARQAIFVHGGSARMKYIMVHNPMGRAFRWVDGYTGFVQFFVANYTTIEGFNDGYTAFDGYDAIGTNPSPMFSNISIQGGGFTGTPGTRGVRLRANGKGAFYNIWVTNTGTGVRTESSATLIFAHNRIWNNNTAYHSSASAFNSSSAPYFNSGDPVSLSQNYKGVEHTGAMDPSTLDPWFTASSYIGAVDPEDDWTAQWITLP